MSDVMPPPANRKERRPLVVWDHIPPVAWVVLLMIAFFGVSAPGFFTAGNFLNIMLQGSVLLIMSVAATLVILRKVSTSP